MNKLLICSFSQQIFWVPIIYKYIVKWYEFRNRYIKNDLWLTGWIPKGDTQEIVIKQLIILW